MTNKHLLETKVRSIKHYQLEIEKLNQALKVNSEVLNETINSLTEFFPFEVGDVLFSVNRRKMIYVTKITGAVLSGDDDGFKIRIEYKRQSSVDGFDRDDYDSFPLAEWNEWKKIN